MPRLTDVRAPIDRFLAAFAGEVAPEGRLDFHVARHSPEGDTWLRVESYTTPLLARLVLEEYVIGGRMRGIVVMAFPRPEYELPIFTVQLGGVGDRSIALLDLSPTVPDADLSPLAPIAERHRVALGLEPTETAWLQGICSPHLLHANYRELDEERFVDAVGDYADVWLDSFYRPGPPAAEGPRRDLVANAIYKFKHQLHHHDPAYGFFARAWGNAAADAFVEIECGDDPAYVHRVPGEDAPKPWVDAERRIVWEEPAQAEVLAAPEDQQGTWRERVESGASADGFGIVTLEVLRRY